MLWWYWQWQEEQEEKQGLFIGNGSGLQTDGAVPKNVFCNQIPANRAPIYLPFKCPLQVRKHPVSY